MAPFYQMLILDDSIPPLGYHYINIMMIMTWWLWLKLLSKNLAKIEDMSICMCE